MKGKDAIALELTGIYYRNRNIHLPEDVWAVYLKFRALIDMQKQEGNIEAPESEVEENQ